MEPLLSPRQVACWCETNDKEKTKAIADAEAKIADLTVKIEELTAASARLIMHLFAKPTQCGNAADAFCDDCRTPGAVDERMRGQRFRVCYR